MAAPATFLDLKDSLGKSALYYAAAKKPPGKDGNAGKKAVKTSVEESEGA